MVFYLKYRPKTLSELDNSEVAQLMERYLTRGSIPHAFLFTGPKGTGKTSTARILAKSINCVKPPQPGQACGKCDVCLSIAGGNNLDILEIDAASNRGIDEIRELREKIKLSPLQLKYKVYIIDEVHMLTTEAFNALLKTLEEPPQHAVFVLATTELHKVPATVVSRCIKLDFHRAKTDEIVHSLKRINKGEQLEISDEVLTLIAEGADGSFRDAAKLLEELVLTHKKITSDDVRRKTGRLGSERIKEFLGFLKEKNTKDLLLFIRRMSEEGVQPQQFFQELLKNLEDLLLAHFERKDKSWTKDELVLAISLFSQSFAELKTAIIATLPFELAVVEYCAGQSVMPSANDSLPPTVVAVDQDESVAPISAKWEKILETLKPFNHSIVGVLRSCRPLLLKDNELTLETAYQFHSERLGDIKVRALIAKTVKDVVGLDVSIKTTLKKR